MKRLVAYFIKYPVAVNVLMLAIVLLGTLGFFQVRSSFFPLEKTTRINITVVYPGASPQEIEEGVVLRIEDNLQGIEGIDRVTSRSYENTGVITVETFENEDIDLILQDVKNAVDRVPSFPVDMEPPIIEKQPNFFPAINFVLSGEGVPLKTLKQIARRIENDLLSMPEISQVNVTGFPDEEIEIAVRENDLRAYNLTFSEVSRAVASANLQTTGGNIKTEAEDYLIRANNRAYFGEELDFIVVKADPNGNVIRLRDVATVSDKWSETPDRIYFNGNAAINFTVQTTISEDILLVADEVKTYIENYNAQYENVQLTISQDATIALNQRTQLLVDNGIIGIILVLVLLSLFLKPSIAFWVAVGLPVGFFGLFIFASSFMTINVISLFGMILVIGILVDDGIVIGENIYFHYEKGKSPIQAAIDGTLEVIPPIVSAILTTMIAFSTFFFLGGRLGAFFGEIAIVVIVILGISLIEALLILPAHLAHSRALKRETKSFILNDYADRVVAFLRDKIYAPMLRFFLNNKVLGFAIPIALFIVTIGSIAGGIIRVTFFPSISSDQVSITLTMPQGTNENITDSLISLIETAAWEANDELTEKQTGKQQVILNATKRIGPGTSTATLSLNLLPVEFRDFEATEVANLIQDKTPKIYGAENLSFSGGNVFGGSPVAVSLLSNNIEELKGAKNALKESLEAMPQLKSVKDDDPAGIKEIDIRLKQNAYLLGLTLNEVMSQVRSGFFGQTAQRLQRGKDEVRVWVRYDRQERESIKSLDDMWIVTPSRNRVPLSEIAEYDIKRGDVAINHLNGQRVITVDADLKNAKDSATDILATLQNDIMPNIQAQYPTVKASYEGQNREAGKMLGTANTAIWPILLLMYVVIAFTFRSYSQPLLLFVLIPFSMVGVAWGHYLHDQPINLLSGLGIVALIGILVNDGLVLIRKFNNLLKDGLPYKEALFQAGTSRFRAIFLTSITTIAGLAPLIFETNFSAQFLIPMAISVAYGIAFATFLTLFLLPMMLNVTNTVKVGAGWIYTGKKPTRESVERAIKEQEVEKEEEEMAGIV